MGYEKAGYWMAVGVMALFVGNQFAARHQDDVRCLAKRALAIVEHTSGQATQLIATAEMKLGRGQSHYARVQTTLACAQTRLASVQSVIAQREAAMARVQAEHARLAALQELRGTVVCPRQNLRIVVPELHAMRADGTI